MERVHHADEDTSIAQYGTFTRTEESRVVWHRSQESAEADAAMTMTNYAFPLRFFDLRAGASGIVEDVGNQITVNDTLKSISGSQPIIEEIAYDLDTWTVQMKARWPW